jgi:hypothetical protein
MKRALVLSLLLLVATAVPLLPACTVAKVVATPVAAVRDVIDIPLAVIATTGDRLATEGKPHTGETSAYAGYLANSGPGIGVGIDVTSPVGYLLKWCFAPLDYLLCRSFAPMWSGSTPIKEERQSWNSFLWPNLRSLWHTEPPAGT